MAQFENGDGPKIEFGEPKTEKRKKQVSNSELTQKAKAKKQTTVNNQVVYTKKSVATKWLIMMLFMITVLCGLIGYAIFFGNSNYELIQKRFEQEYRLKIENLEQRILIIEEKLDIEDKSS